MDSGAIIGSLIFGVLAVGFLAWCCFVPIGRNGERGWPWEGK